MVHPLDDKQLTLFAIPKAFRGHINVIQRNAVKSWTLLNPRPRIILFGNDEGTAEIADEMKTEYVPAVARSEYGTPMIQDVFRQAVELSKTRLLCYINSDIILLSNFIDAFQIVSQKKNFLMCGRRWNLDIQQNIDFNSDWENWLRERVKIEGKLEEPWAIDYFVFNREVVSKMPPFIIGRPAWDNWLIYSARISGCAVINATESVMVVHQNHDYAHVPRGSGLNVDGPEADYNIRLAGKLAREFSLRDATHVLTSNKIKRALSKDSIVRLLDMTPLIKPWTAPLVKAIRLLLSITKPVRSLVLAGRNKN